MLSSRAFEALATHLRGRACARVVLDESCSALARRLLDDGRVERASLYSAAGSPELDALVRDHGERANVVPQSLHDVGLHRYLDIAFGGRRASEAQRDLFDPDATVVAALREPKLLHHVVVSAAHGSACAKEYAFAFSPRAYEKFDATVGAKFAHKPIATMCDLLFDARQIAEDEESRLVVFEPKPEPPVASDRLPLMWYFFKQHLCNKRNRIIPMLEKWIPDCGVWLITEQDPPDSRSDLRPDHRDEPLPHMTIFTQFSDLTPKQKVTLFKRFTSWPDFEESIFREAVENESYKNLLRKDLIDKSDFLTQEDTDEAD